MQIGDVIKELEAENEGSRSLDSSIALALGWERTPKVLKNEVTGKVTTKYLWFDPASNKRVTVPHFTTSVQDAFEFSQLVDPECVGALRRDPEGYMAQIEDEGTESYAATAPIAICLATLRFMEKKGIIPQ